MNAAAAGEAPPAAELALRGLVEAYARAADDRDGPGFGALFAADAVLTTSDGGRLVGREAIATIPSRLARYDATGHRIGPSSFSIAGDAASGTTACEAHHVRGDLDTVMTITYHDIFVLDPDGSWRFASRFVDILRSDDVAGEP